MTTPQLTFYKPLVLSPLKSPMLLALVALFFAIGHGHQVFDRFETHHHDLVGHHHDGVPEAPDGAPAGGEDHWEWHHAVLGIVEVAHESFVGQMELLSRIESVAVIPPEAPVLGIEHPPQVALG